MIIRDRIDLQVVEADLKSPEFDKIVTIEIKFGHWFRTLASVVLTSFVSVPLRLVSLLFKLRVHSMGSEPAG